MIHYYRVKQAKVKALLWEGNNFKEVMEFLGKALISEEYAFGSRTPNALTVNTPEGWIVAIPGDYIAKTVNNSYFVYKPDIFNEMFERT